MKRQHTVLFVLTVLVLGALACNVGGALDGTAPICGITFQQLRYPIPPGVSDCTSDGSGTAVFTAKMSTAEVVQFYKGFFADNGWTVESEDSDSGIVAVKSSTTIDVSVSAMVSDPNRTGVIVKIDPPEERASDFGLAAPFTILVLCFIALTWIAVFAVGFVIRFANRKKAQSLMATGKQGEATVLQLEDTGMRINDDPRVALLLEVRIPGYPPYHIRKTVTIPMIRLSQVQVGSVVAVIADPMQPQNSDKVGLLLK